MPTLTPFTAVARHFRGPPPYRNPLVRLGALVLPMLLFRFGMSGGPSPTGSDPPRRLDLNVACVPVRRTPPATPPATLPASDTVLRFFQPSISLSSRRLLSFSSRSSRSARRADSSLVLSLACSSSMVLSSLSTLSRRRATSSCIWLFC